MLGSEIMSEFGVSELLLLSKDPLCQVRKHAILAFGAVSSILDVQQVEEDIFNALLLNARVPPTPPLVRRVPRGW